MYFTHKSFLHYYYYYYYYYHHHHQHHHNHHQQDLRTQESRTELSMSSPWINVFPSVDPSQHIAWMTEAKHLANEFSYSQIPVFDPGAPPPQYDLIVTSI